MTSHMMLEVGLAIKFLHFFTVILYRKYPRKYISK